MTATQAVESRTRRARALLVLAVLVFAAVTVSFVGSGSKARAQEPATPVCPEGSTFNTATGQCETPSTLAPCPTGTTLSGATCTATVVCPPAFFGPFPAPRQVIDNPTGATTATCAGPFGTDQQIACPAGTTVTSFFVGSVLTGVSGSITCTTPAVATCPVGFTPSGTVCVAPPTLACPPGFTLSGTTCVPPATTTTTPAAATCPQGTALREIPFRGPTCLPLGGTAGDIDASGGDAGSVRGGDGGRGGSGTLPVCNQNTNGSSWEELVQEVDEDGYVVDEYVVVHEAEPSLDCEAGGRGGSGGDAGIAEGGDGGLAFSVG